MEQEPIITLSNISKSYEKRKILSSVNLSILPGHVYLLQGSNGSGKSTLIKIAANLVAPSSGIRKAAASRAIRIGYAPDHLPKLKLSSSEYLRYMGRIAGMDKQVLADKILELHRLFQLDPDSSAYLLHYSKGMLQKVNLMQASLQKPDLLLLDEPLSGLDAESQAHLLEALQKIHGQGTAIVAAVHDSLLIEALGGTLLQLNEGILSAEPGVPSKPAAAAPGSLVEVKGKAEPDVLAEILMRYPQARRKPVESMDSTGSDDYTVHLPHVQSQAFLLALLQAGAVVDRMIPIKEG
ncbi:MULTISPECIES: ATP-binding cassette domain-containing protein [unclassified Paenibacillus]|uniref:ATP-binding cassette domain-containing protein n=1 Tax=unclassified Paenibacillus TaxID=185978 RepID=UPI0009544BD7|nr:MULTISPECIES: ATP-binding cassette domain-containing protein [unclassified Paenibacillus]ASS65320.2 ATP-binding cassette domain-containing protein [Paenibacillus sp. RUD330]SIQ40039.1 ABC-type multidrug transport system, ATPase component [Paenibacillus sp. RU4X]SIQ62209.1 ABC-type multidrug transport system, ATPase component [Paenibacillus sp. RU4T]